MDKSIEANDKIYRLAMLDLICGKLGISFDDIIKKTKEIKENVKK